MDPEVEKEVEKDVRKMQPPPDEDMEAWEDELEENTRDPGSEIRPWDILREKLQKTIKERHKTLPLTHLNQLIILSDFATLCLKGHTRTAASLMISEQWKTSSGYWMARHIHYLARFYQQFETLPENHGGRWMARSFLFRDEVKMAFTSFLNSVPNGTMTPRVLMNHVNETIFLELGIQPTRPISLRTACRWLVQLGWVISRVKKGVYVDGQE
jgi:hypothetical protein